VTANPHERAVIEAACRWFDLPGTGGNDELIEAVRTLKAYEGPHASIEQFAEELKGIDRRAHGVFMREYQASFLPYHGHGWPRLDLLVQFAALPADDIIDVRNAGPATWKVWATLLRKHGIEPTWAEVIGE
jgi:hypothetical protein